MDSKIEKPGTDLRLKDGTTAARQVQPLEPVLILRLFTHRGHLDELRIEAGYALNEVVLCNHHVEDVLVPP